MIAANSIHLAQLSSGKLYIHLLSSGKLYTHLLSRGSLRSIELANCVQVHVAALKEETQQLRVHWRAVVSPVEDEVCACSVREVLPVHEVLLFR